MEMKLSQALLWSALLLLIGSVALRGDKQANGSRGAPPQGFDISKCPVDTPN
jgi:hypothetical protein